MKLILTFVVALTTFLSVCDAALYDVAFARILAPQSYFRSVAILSNGDAVSVGYVYGLYGTAAYGSGDFVMQRYTPAGDVVWTRQIGSVGFDLALGVKCDSEDNIYVSGSVQESMNGNAYAGGEDAAVVKLDSAGNQIFAVQFGGSGGEIGLAVCLDEPNNAFYLVGGSTTSPVLNGFAKVGSKNAFVTKFHSGTGAILKHIQVTPDGTDFYGCGIDTNGDLWVGGSTPTSYFGTTGGGALLQKFGADGSSLFANVLNGAGAYNFAIDDNDNKYLTGHSTGVTIDGQANAGSTDAVVARFNSAGVKVWAKLFGGTNVDYGTCSAPDAASGRLFVSGVTTSPSFLGMTNAGSTHNSFLLVLSIADGSVLYKTLYGTAGVHSKPQCVSTNGMYTYLMGGVHGNFQGQIASTTFEHGYLLALTTGSASPTALPTLQPVALPTGAPIAEPTVSPSAPPCVLWALADYGETCSATCSGLQRVCKPKYFETVVTQEGFYNAVGAAVNVRAGGSPIGSAQAFCSQATTASTSVSVPAVITMVLNAAGNDPVRRTCTYPTSAATDCDAALPVFSSVRRLCPCVDHNCDDAFYLGYSGDSCGATCSNVARTCDAEKLSEIVDATSFSAMVVSTTAVDTNAPIGSSAEAFCTLGTNLLNVSTAPAALTFVQGAVNQTLCAFPTSTELLHGDCDVSFTGAFPAQRFCNCRVPVNPAHRQLTALPPLNEKVAEVVHSAPVVVSPRLRRV